MQTKTHFFKPTFVKMIIWILPFLIIFLIPVFKGGGIGGGLFLLVGIGFIFCGSFWGCSPIEITPGLIVVYFGWYFIACLLVLAYQKIKGRK